MCQPLGQRFPRPIGIGLLAVGLLETAGKGRHQPEIDVHRLEGRGIRATGDVAEKRAERRFDRRRGQGLAAKLGGGEAGGENADRGAFDIALAARDLPGETDVGPGLQAQLAVEQPRRVDEAVAVDPAEARELGILEAGDGAKIRICSPCFSLVWKPTMFHKVARALSWRSWTTA